MSLFLFLLLYMFFSICIIPSIIYIYVCLDKEEWSKWNIRFTYYTLTQLKEIGMDGKEIPSYDDRIPVFGKMVMCSLFWPMLFPVYGICLLIRLIFVIISHILITLMKKVDGVSINIKGDTE